MKRLVLPLIALAATSALADKGDPKKPAQIPKDCVKWAASWDEAVKEATERNVPIHVGYHKDN